MGDIRDRVWESRLNAELSTLYYQERAARAVKTSKGLKALSSLLSTTSVTSFAAAFGASQWALGILGAVLGLSVTIINGIAIWRDEDAKITDFAEAYGGWSDQLSQWRIQWGRLQAGDNVPLDTVERTHSPWHVLKRARTSGWRRGLGERQRRDAGVGFAAVDGVDDPLERVETVELCGFHHGVHDGGDFGAALGA